MLLIAAVLCPCSASGDAIRISWISDIHYDPYYGTANADGRCRDNSFDRMGTYGCDAPISLVRSAIADIKAVDPDYLIMSGDWLRHSMSLLPLSDAIPAFNTVAQVVSEFSGGIIPLPNTAGVLGNNDYIPDYFFNLSAPTHPLLANMTNVLQNHSLLDESEATTFSRCAFYYRELRNSSLSILSLNTLVWTVSLSPDPVPPGSDPCKQFEFFIASLEQARQRGRRVLIVSHIPVGLNAYDVLNEGFNTSEPVYFQDAFAVRYAGIVSNYSDVIIAQLFGHTHKFSFIADYSMKVPAFIAPAISPVFDNNPSYLVVTLNATSLDLIDIEQRYLAPNKSAWIDGQGLRGMLNIPRITLDSLRHAVDALLYNDSMWNRLVLAYGGGIPTNAFPVSDCRHECRATFCCSMAKIRLADIEACSAASGMPQPTTHIPSGQPSGTPQPSSSMSPDATPAPTQNQKGSDRHTLTIVLACIAGAVTVAIVGVAIVKSKRRCPFGPDKEQLIN